MRKILFILTAFACILLCTCGLAEIYVLDPIYATVDIPENYTVLTPENLTRYSTWLSAKGTSEEEAAADFEKRSVLLQAWDTENNRLFELRAKQTQDTLMVFDINLQSTEYRGSYRTSHYPKNEYDGYAFTSSDWKTTDNGRFLVLKYSRKDNGEILYRGFMRRTIRNGYEIDLDMQIYDRSTTSKDNHALNVIWDTFSFVEILDLPPAASAKINFTKTPPKETNDSSFTITGTASEGVSFVAVTMGLNYTDPIVSNYTVGKDGKFAIPITLPKEGSFLVTLTAEYQNETVLEASYPIKYQHSLLYVNFTTQPEGTVMESEVKFAGDAEPGASIQVYINGEKTATKKVNGEGRFSFTVDLKEEDSYEVSLIFSKKNLADNRFTFTIQRKYNSADMIKALKKQAVSPAYSKLVSGIEKYEGKVLGYKGYITDISTSGGEYIIRMALAKKNNKYSNYIVVTSSDEPTFAVGKRVYIYGTCEGLTLGDTDENESIPCLSLILFVDVGS